MEKFHAARKTKKTKKKKISLETGIGIPYYLLLIFLIIIPFAIMMLYAFNDANESIFQIQFSTVHFARFFMEPSFLRTMAYSLYLAFISTVVTLVVAYPLAYIIARSKPRMQVLYLLLVTSPMWINMLLRANALKQVFDMINPNLLGTNFAMVVGMVYMYLPYMVLPIYAILSKIDENLFESSADLGANKFQTIVRVIIPLSLSGVLAGCMMVFLPSATTLVVPRYLGDGQVTMIGRLIDYAIIDEGNYGYGAAISLVLAAIMMVSIFLVKKLDKYEGVLANEDE